MLVCISDLITWSRNAFSLLQVVVHVKTFFSDVKVVDFDSFFLRRILSLPDDFLLVDMKRWQLVLSNIPGDIFMSAIGVHLLRGYH